MTQDQTSAKAVAALTPRELEAYRKYLDSGKPPLAASTASNFFALYLQGHTCEEIAKLNPSFGLGLIVRARVDFDWDQQRIDHVQHLLDNMRQVVQTAQLSAVQFVAEGLAVYQKQAGSAFQKYLQSGKEEDLGNFRDMNFKTYKELLELLLKLTGQQPAQKVQGVVEHRHMVETPAAAIQINQPMTAAAATDFLAALDKTKQ